MKVVGLTGNSGSGKSYVANIFAEEDAYIIDADKIGHKILEKNSLPYKEVIEFFGVEILDADKNINRKALGKIVFSNKEKLQKLNSITHKHIIKTIMHKIDKAKASGNKISIIDAALLIEVNLHKVCDKVVIVHADKNIRIKRIMERDHISEQDAFNRINNQSPFEDLEKYADIVILNNKNDNSLREDVKNIARACIHE